MKSEEVVFMIRFDQIWSDHSDGKILSNIFDDYSHKIILLDN